MTLYFGYCDIVISTDKKTNKQISIFADTKRINSGKDGYMTERNKMWFNGIMGVVVGDALGLPVQFKCREELEKNPLKDMIGYGTFHMPEGSWSDDSSLTLAALASIRECNGINLEDIMKRFAEWLIEGEYTPFGYAYDQGATCIRAITNYVKSHDVESCGVTGERANGNGALMRIMPVCLWAYEKEQAGEWTVEKAIEQIHKVAGLTHNHLRSHIACGIYYFMVKNILNHAGNLQERLQTGMNEAAEFYRNDIRNLVQWEHYQRMSDMKVFQTVPVERIKSSGYVVDSLEAAVWCLLNTDTFEDCLLKASNLGYDTDTVAAIAGGLAGLFYGGEKIPQGWLDKLQKKEWVKGLIEL